MRVTTILLVSRPGTSSCIRGVCIPPQAVVWVILPRGYTADTHVWMVKCSPFRDVRSLEDGFESRPFHARVLTLYSHPSTAKSPQSHRFPGKTARLIPAASTNFPFHFSYVWDVISARTLAAVQRPRDHARRDEEGCPAGDRAVRGRLRSQVPEGRGLAAPGRVGVVAFLKIWSAAFARSISLGKGELWPRAAGESKSHGASRCWRRCASSPRRARSGGRARPVERIASIRTRLGRSRAGKILRSRAAPWAVRRLLAIDVFGFSGSRSAAAGCSAAKRPSGPTCGSPDSRGRSRRPAPRFRTRPCGRHPTRASCEGCR